MLFLFIGDALQLRVSLKIQSTHGESRISRKRRDCDAVWQPMKRNHEMPKNRIARQWDYIEKYKICSYINPRETSKKVYSHTHKMLKKSALVKKKQEYYSLDHGIFSSHSYDVFFISSSLPWETEPDLNKNKNYVTNIQKYRMFRPNIHTCRHSVRRLASNKSRNITIFFSSSPTRIRNKMNYPATEITLQKNEKKKKINIFKVQIEQWRKRKNRQTCRKKSTYTHVST